MAKQQILFVLLLAILCQFSFTLTVSQNALPVKYTLGNWTTCSRFCNGVQNRTVVCTDYKCLPVNETRCVSAGLTRPADQQVCNYCPYEFYATNWGGCSQTCAFNNSQSIQYGLQTRSRQCYNIPTPGATPQTALDAACTTNNVPAPPISRICNTELCGAQYSFLIVNTQSFCSASCGNSNDVTLDWIARNVTCIDSTGQVVADQLCLNQGLIKPANVTLCNTQPCTPSYQVTAEWGPCTDSTTSQFGRPIACGGGYSIRTLACYDPTTLTYTVIQPGQAIANNPCGSRAPLIVQPCNTQACLTEYNWYTGAFGGCFPKCSADAYANRTVTCIDSTTNATVADSFCLNFAPKPTTVQPCYSCRPTIAISAPTACSAPCTNSTSFPTQDRIVSCVDEAGTTLASASCAAFVSSLPDYPGAFPYTRRSICNTQRCSNFVWTVVNATTCSQVCYNATATPGVYGITTRAIACIDSDAGTVVADSFCSSIVNARPPVNTTCNTQACTFSWQTSAYGGCNLPCTSSGQAPGNQTRDVYCVAQDHPTYPVLNSYCDHLPNKPNATRICNTEPCDAAFKFFVSEWGTCSVACASITNSNAGGIQTRTVACVDSIGIVQNNTRCNAIGFPTPPTSRACNTQACGYYYRYSNWNGCSLNCASSSSVVGTETRTVECVDGTTGNTFPLATCQTNTNQTIPATRRVCNTHSCLNQYSYVTGAWGPCASGCGNQTREVYCVDQLGQRVNETFCDREASQTNANGVLSKPSATQLCPACTPQWQISEWTTCSTPCTQPDLGLIGTQTRQVRCLDPFGQISTGCPISRPFDRQPCNTHNCTNIVFQSVQLPCNKTCGGGYAPINVTCVDANAGQPVAESACTLLGLTKPPTLIPCNTAACSYSYIVSAWGPCVYGLNQTRNLACYSAEAKSLLPDNTLCAGLTAPATSRPCVDKLVCEDCAPPV